MFQGEDGVSTRNEWELSRPLHMSSKFIPIAPLEDSQSLFDLSAVLPAGRPRDASSPFGLPFHVTHSFLKNPEVPTLSCKEFHRQK